MMGGGTQGHAATPAGRDRATLGCRRPCRWHGAGRPESGPWRHGPVCRNDGCNNECPYQAENRWHGPGVGVSRVRWTEGNAGRCGHGYGQGCGPACGYGGGPKGADGDSPGFRPVPGWNPGNRTNTRGVLKGRTGRSNVGGSREPQRHPVGVGSRVRHDPGRRMPCDVTKVGPQGPNADGLGFSRGSGFSSSPVSPKRSVRRREWRTSPTGVGTRPETGRSDDVPAGGRCSERRRPCGRD